MLTIKTAIENLIVCFLLFHDKLVRSVVSSKDQPHVDYQQDPFSLNQMKLLNDGLSTVERFTNLAYDNIRLTHAQNKAEILKMLSKVDETLPRLDHGLNKIDDLENTIQYQANKLNQVEEANKVLVKRIEKIEKESEHKSRMMIQQRRIFRQQLRTERNSFIDKLDRLKQQRKESELSREEEKITEVNLDDTVSSVTIEDELFSNTSDTTIKNIINNAIYDNSQARLAEIFSRGPLKMKLKIFVS